MLYANRQLLACIYGRNDLSPALASQKMSRFCEQRPTDGSRLWLKEVSADRSNCLRDVIGLWVPALRAGNAPRINRPQRATNQPSFSSEARSIDSTPISPAMRMSLK